MLRCCELGSRSLAAPDWCGKCRAKSNAPPARAFGRSREKRPAWTCAACHKAGGKSGFGGTIGGTPSTMQPVLCAKSVNYAGFVRAPVPPSPSLAKSIPRNAFQHHRPTVGVATRIPAHRPYGPSFRARRTWIPACAGGRRIESPHSQRRGKLPCLIAWQTCRIYSGQRRAFAGMMPRQSNPHLPPMGE